MRAFPALFLLDAEGRIRHTDLRGAAIGSAVDRLLRELEERERRERAEEGPADERAGRPAEAPGGGR